MQTLLRHLEELGISLSATGDQLNIYDPKNALTAKLLADLRINKSVLLALLKGGSRDHTYNPIPRAPRKDTYKLSAAQRRLYFQYEFNKSSLAYNIPQAVILKGVPDKRKLREVFIRLLQRHEIFRTSFGIGNDDPVQYIVKDFSFEIEDLGQADTRLAEKIQHFVRPFSLDRPPLFRAGLIERSATEFILVVDMPHIVSDGVSAGILIRDFMAFYEDKELPECRLQYKDYAEWQQSDDYHRANAARREFWMKQFAEKPSVLALPADHKRPPVKIYDGNTLSLEIDEQETEKLRSLALKEGVTLYMVFFSLFSILLSKCSNQQDLTIGTVTTGRDHPDLANMIGMFANTLVVRNDVKGELAFREFLCAAKERILACLDNQAFPYEELVNLLNPERDASRNPLFDVMFSYENFEHTQFELSDLILEAYPMDQTVSKFDLTLTVVENVRSISLTFEYATSLFKEVTIRKMIGYFKRIASAVAADPGIRLSTIDILSDTQKNELLHVFNNTQTLYPADRTVIELIIDQVRRTPANTAIIFEDQRFSYRELDEASNRLAHYLRDRCSIGPNDLVGILLSRSDKLVIAILAVLKAGGAYVPIDPAYPHARIRLIADNSALKTIITEDDHSYRPEGLHIVSLTEDADAIRQYPTTDLPKITSPNDLIYVIYTSGSTGIPKGAMVKQHSFTNLVSWYGKMLKMTEQDVVLLMAPVSFDLAQKNIFTPLVHGAAICLSENLHLDYPATAMAIEDHHITIVNTAPSAFYPLMEEDHHVNYRRLRTVRKVILGGEPIHTNELTGWRKSPYYNAGIINSYGPTECTDVVSYYELDKEVFASGKPVPIGRPVDNTVLYILDDNGSLLPPPMVGEICIGGVGVGKGYLNNSDLTEKKFIKNPFSAEGYLYRTGDLGRWLTDGNIEFIGRKDDQVKIHGVRIEPAEIESSLSAHPEVRHAIVVASNTGGDECLIAYYVSVSQIGVHEWRAFLAERIPGYMIPSYYVHLRELPLSPNGKIDKRSLPKPEGAANINIIPPINQIQRDLLQIWAEVLNIEPDRIGINSNFFDLGGHSLRIIQVNKKVNDSMHCNISVADTFRLSSIAAMADYITNGERRSEQMEEELASRDDLLDIVNRSIL